MIKMIEQVALAIARHHILGSQFVAPDISRDDIVRGEHWVKHARAAIEAMREPTEEMLAAMPEIFEPRRTAAGPWVTSREVGTEKWQAIIDAALGEGLERPQR